jgi:predicted dienelactone hydrolase
MMLAIRTWIAVALVTLAGVTLAGAAGATGIGYQYTSFPAPDGREIELSIWYPTDAPATPQPFGPFEQSVAKNGAVAGSALPLIVISHGTGGSFGGHYDTAQALARAGFVVAALSHPGDNFQDRSDSFTWPNFVNRPRQLSATIDYMLSAWRDRDRIDPARIGVFGHSAGGYTALASVGGMPELARITAFCRAHPDDWGCEQARAKNAKFEHDDPPSATWAADPRIKAVVVAASAAANMLTPQSLARVTVPVQLWEAQNDRIVTNGIIGKELAKPPELHVVANAGHYDFLAPCNPSLAARFPEICESAPGFDRTAFHDAFNHDVAAFFTAALEKK